MMNLDGHQVATAQGCVQGGGGAARGSAGRGGGALGAVGHHDHDDLPRRRARLDEPAGGEARVVHQCGVRPARAVVDHGDSAWRGSRARLDHLVDVDKGTRLRGRRQWRAECDRRRQRLDSLVEAHAHLVEQCGAACFIL